MNKHKCKYIIIGFALIWMFIPNIIFAEEYNVPEEIIRYSENIEIASDGKTQVDVEVQMSVDKPGTYMVPLGNSDAEDLRLINGAAIKESIIIVNGIKYIGLKLNTIVNEDTTIHLSYTVPELLNFSDAPRDALGRTRFGYTFQNTVATTIDNYELKVYLPESFKVHYSDEIMDVSRDKSKNADTMSVFNENNQRGGFEITKKDLKYGKTSSHTVETTDKKQFSIFFASMLLLIALGSLFYYRDLVIKLNKIRN